MPLDTSTYALALLRLDGRRWNELRRIHGQISTQASADGSSYLEMGNTKVICTVSGPAELRRSAAGTAAAQATAGAGGGRNEEDRANIVAEISIAGFSGVDRKRRGRGDKRTTELSHTLSSAFSPLLFTHLYPRSTILLNLHVLALDGALLAACINASTLALVDAGIPMSDYLVACTAGSTLAPALTTTTTSSRGGGGEDENPDPLLDLSGTEEQELPFLTVATVGGSEKVSVLVMESRIRVERVEGMLAVGVDGCKQVREILDGVVRRHGAQMLEGDAVG